MDSYMGFLYAILIGIYSYIQRHDQVNCMYIGFYSSSSRSRSENLDHLYTCMCLVSLLYGFTNMNLNVGVMRPTGFIMLFLDPLFEFRRLMIPVRKTRHILHLVEDNTRFFTFLHIYNFHIFLGTNPKSNPTPLAHNFLSKVYGTET